VPLHHGAWSGAFVERLGVSGAPPPPRAGAAHAAVGMRTFVFGGAAEGGKTFDDVWWGCTS
jgi:hypothetical protein